MALSVKVRCGSWDQLAALLDRDLRRGALFIRTERPPPAGSEMRIELTLPSGSVVPLAGQASAPVNGPRGAGVDVLFAQLPHSVLWVIESALAAAGKGAGAPEPLVADEPKAAAAEDDLIVALEQELLSLRAMNPFQVLGLPYDTTDDAVRAAFGELSKKYHPDRFARYESERARLAAAEIFMVVREAYRRVSTAAGRQAAVPRRSAPPIAEAEFLMANGHYAEARSAYDAVLQAKPGDRAARAGRELAVAFELLANGDRDGAASRFDAVLEIDPTNERAARELAAVRRASTESRKGVLGKLLGRQR